MHEIWTMFGDNWHKIIVLFLLGAQVWKFFFQYIRPTIHHDKAVQPISITLPPQGCTITVKPLPVEEAKED